MNKLYDESSIQAIANAIRNKNGSSDTYTVSQMSTAINNIPSGSSTALQGLPLNNQKNNVIVNTLEDNTSVNNLFNGAVDWGDGTTDSYSIHTYTKAGYYTISSLNNITSSVSGQITEAEIITTIGSYSTTFQDNTNLNKAIVSNLAESLFSGCTGLKKLTVTDSVTNIPNSCFKSVDMDCWDIPNTVTSISISAFQSAKNIAFPNNTITATNIGGYAFRYANFKNKILTIGAENIVSYGFDSTNLEVVKFTNLNPAGYSSSNILTNNKLYEVIFNSIGGSEPLSSNPIISASTNVYRNIHFTSTSPVSQYTTTALNLSNKDTIYCPVGYLSNYQTAFNDILNGADLLEEPANGITISYDYYNTGWLATFGIHGYITNNSNQDKAITSISFNYGDAVLDDSTATLNIGSSYLPIAGVYDTTNHTITFTVDETLTTTELSKPFYMLITLNSSSGGSYTVPKNAFTCTAGLVWIIPEGTTTVGTDYQDNTDLVKVVMPNSVTSISNNAFKGCSALQSINIPESVTSIGDFAFYLCSSLNNFDFTNITYIGQEAFSGTSSAKATALTSVFLPSTITTLKTRAFRHNVNLTTVFIDCGIPNNSTNNAAIFSGCTHLQSVTVGPNVTVLGPANNQYAIFAQTNSRWVMHLQGTTPPTTTGIYGTYVPAAIYVPASAVETYQNDSVWSTYASVIQAEPTVGE